MRDLSPFHSSIFDWGCSPGFSSDGPAAGSATSHHLTCPSGKRVAGSENRSSYEEAGRHDEARWRDRKSKLEQETGTVNDRIFAVLPNYGTVETSKTLPPLSSGQKFKLATASVFDWTAYPFNGVLAAISQAKNDPSSWGQGWGAYGKRYGASFADNSIGTYMTTAVFPSLLHEDPRYYQLGKGSFSHRAYYAMNRLFVSRTDAGSSSFNYSEFSAMLRPRQSLISTTRPGPNRIPKRNHLWFSDSLRWLGQRTQGILAGYTPQSASQEESLVPLDTPVPLALGSRRRCRRYRSKCRVRHPSRSLRRVGILRKAKIPLRNQIPPTR